MNPFLLRKFLLEGFFQRDSCKQGKREGALHRKVAIFNQLLWKTDPLHNNHVQVILWFHQKSNTLPIGVGFADFKVHFASRSSHNMLEEKISIVIFLAFNYGTVKHLLCEYL